MLASRSGCQVYTAREDGIRCSKWIKQKHGTSSGHVRPSRPWLNLATPLLPSTAVSAGGGSAPFMPTMRLGTSVSSIRATKEARV